MITEVVKQIDFKNNKTSRDKQDVFKQIENNWKILCLLVVDSKNMKIQRNLTKFGETIATDVEETNKFLKFKERN